MGRMRHSHANTLSLSDSSAVRKDAEGVPVAFRVLRRGVNDLTLDGVYHELRLDDEHIRQILDYHRLKGELIPVDAEHYLSDLATRLGVDESDLLAQDPKLGEAAAEGFVRLVGEEDGIWAHVTKWCDRAKNLLKATDKVYGYFSPVVRGLRNGPLRITSLALTNHPALNQLDVLAARGERKIREQTQIGEEMNTQLKKLADLLGFDAVALTGGKPDLAPMLDKAIVVIEDGRAAGAQVNEFLGGVKDALELADGQGLDMATGKVLSLAEKAKADAVALSEAQAKISEFEAETKSRLITSLKDEGKLTDAMTAWAEKQDVAALKEFAENAPVLVKTTRETKPGDKPVDDDDTVELSDAEKKICLACGQDPADVAKVRLPKIGE